MIRNFTSTTGAGLEPEPLTNLKSGAGAAPKIGRLRIPVINNRLVQINFISNLIRILFTSLKGAANWKAAGLSIGWIKLHSYFILKRITKQKTGSKILKCEVFVILNFTSTTGAVLEPEPEPLTNLKPGAGAAPKIGRLCIPANRPYVFF